jgi:hypothetical protein
LPKVQHGMFQRSNSVTIQVCALGFVIIEDGWTDKPKVYAFEDFDHLVQFLRNRVADILLEREEGEQ